MKEMKYIVVVSLLALAGCQMPSYYHAPGGPYYIKSAVTYQGFRPNGEITKQEANAFAQQGYAYSIAFFDNTGQPTNIQEVYNGKIESHIDLIYSNAVLREIRSTDREGIQRWTHLDEKGRLMNPQPRPEPYR